MKYCLLIVSFLFLGSGFVLAQKEQIKKGVTNTVINEVVIRTEVKQNLEGKVWDMGAYYYCKFSRDDERKAILDGWILVSPYRLEQIRASVAGEQGVSMMDVSIINAKENEKYGSYEVCAGGTKYTYIRRADNYVRYRKVDYKQKR